MTNGGHFEDAVDKVAADRSPRSEVAGLSAEEQRMVRMAQLLHGSQAHEVDPEFRDRLHARLVPGERRYTRRRAFLSSLGALAAGAVAGVEVDRLVRGTGGSTNPVTPLVGANGKWVPVAQVADLPSGAVKSFSAGALQGYVINHNGQVRAISRACTHMGCSVNFSHDEQHFVCPCHGAEFDVNGRFLYGSQGRPYSPALAPLPPITTRINGPDIEVWTV